jgi:hypothetical protein
MTHTIKSCSFVTDKASNVRFVIPCFIYRIRKQTHLSLLEGVHSQNNPVDGLALHPVNLVAACPQKECLYLAKPEPLEQGPGKIESASEAKIHQAVDGPHLKVCNLADLLINAICSSAEGKNGWSYTFSSPCFFMACMWTPLCLC